MGLGAIVWRAELYQHWHKQSLWIPSCSVDELIGLPLQASDGPKCCEWIACSGARIELQKCIGAIVPKICVVAQTSDLLTIPLHRLAFQMQAQLVRKQKLHFASHIYISHHLCSSAANGSVLPRQHPKQSRSRMANHTSNSHRKDVFNYQKATQMDDASISMWRDDEQWTKCE